MNSIRMTTSLPVLAVLLAGASLSALPAMAQSTAPNAGPATVETTRDLAEMLPAAKQMDVPKLDPAASRDIGPADPTAALAALGVTVVKSTGEITQVPASAAVKAALDAAMSTPGGAFELPADRDVIGPDDRMAVTAETEYPYRAIGQLFMQYGENWGKCSGTLIGPYTVITAGHCLYNPDEGGFPTRVVFRPGDNAPNIAPLGQFEFDQLLVLQGFVDNYNPKAYDTPAMEYDVALITLSEDAGNQFGWFGFQADVNEDFTAHLISYPGDKEEETMWATTCPVRAIDMAEKYAAHDCDMEPGSSGGSMYDDTADGPMIRELNVAESGDINWSTRITPTYYQWILDNWK